MKLKQKITRIQKRFSHLSGTAKTCLAVGALLVAGGAGFGIRSYIQARNSTPQAVTKETSVTNLKAAGFKDRVLLTYPHSRGHNIDVHRADPGHLTGIKGKADLGNVINTFDEHSVSFRPCGIIIKADGKAYVGEPSSSRERYIGRLVTSPAVQRRIQKAPDQMYVYGQHSQFAYALQLGTLRGFPISIRIPRKYAKIYQDRSAANVRFLYTRRYAQTGNERDRAVLASGQNGGRFTAALRADLLADVNHARKKDGQRALLYSKSLSVLNRLRTLQAAQAYRTEDRQTTDQMQEKGQDADSDEWIHGQREQTTNVADGQLTGIVPYDVRDGAKVVNECAGDTAYGKTTLDDLGREIRFDARTPQALADEIVKTMLDDDQFAHNAHRRNLLNPRTRFVSVAVEKYGHGSSARFVYVLETN